MFCKYENDTRIYKIQTRLFPKGHQLGRMQPRIQCWRLQVIWNIQYKNYKFETVHTHTHTQYNISTTYICMMQQHTTTRGHSATSTYVPDVLSSSSLSFYRETPVEIQWTGISFVSQSLTHFLPYPCHFRALISFPPFPVKTLNQFTSFKRFSCENRAATFASTWKLQASMHTYKLFIYNLTCFGPHTYVNLHTHTHIYMHTCTWLVAYFIVLLTT